MELSTFKEYTAQVLDELPAEFFRELSGGIIVRDDAKPSPYAARGDDLYILGEYWVSGAGKQILLYFGSFQKLFPWMDGERLKQEIRSVVRHEFRHHMEYLSGIHGGDSLEAEDARDLALYRQAVADRERAEREKK